ncbi:MAG: bifunctional phosphoribosylaminoimidazolecarboxamide formyltransferase/IMP cyclohydrolase, partial [Rhizobacter sp.]|nr:bifunctional phosphoribosylaminoimidazolecarboxamide formyltransferase/IMP cyclohydrolase [Chlorobiales bacterium]
AKYDAAIANYLAPVELTTSSELKSETKAEPTVEPTENAEQRLDASFEIHLKKTLEMRYGENPHQKAALYAVTSSQGDSSFDEYFEKLHGKDLSYNNVLDLTAAAMLIGEFDNDLPTAVIIKHTNPCGAAQDEALERAYRKAFSTDTQAPFGGIIAVNRPLDLATAQAINEIFTEVIIAPHYESGVLELLQKKKDRRLIQMKKNPLVAGLEMRAVAGGVLVSERDVKKITAADLKVVTQRKPTDEETADLLFAWRVAGHVKSTAIVYSNGLHTLCVGAGQMSRVVSVKIAGWKASEAGLDLKGSAVASDAFFPFADGLIAAADAGATAVTQPGGSVRDEEVIAAADARGIAMVFTGVRHFRH